MSGLIRARQKRAAPVLIGAAGLGLTAHHYDLKAVGQGLWTAFLAVFTLGRRSVLRGGQVQFVRLIISRDGACAARRLNCGNRFELTR